MCSVSHYISSEKVVSVLTLKLRLLNWVVVAMYRISHGKSGTRCYRYMHQVHGCKVQTQRRECRSHTRLRIYMYELPWDIAFP